MADRPKPFDLAKEARHLADAEQVTRHKPAVPPAYPGNLGRLGMGKLPIPPKKPEPLPLAVKSAPEATRVDDGYLQPAPESAPMPDSLDTLKGIGPRKNSPPPFSRPPPPSSPTTPLERDVVRLRAELAELQEERLAARQSVVIPAQPGWVEPAWWRTTGGMVKVMGALFAGLTSLGVGGWLMSQKPEPEPKPVAPTDISCPPFADEHAPRGALCGDIYRLQGALGKLQAERDAELMRRGREQTMLGGEPTVKP